jgi:hypothetical protein
MTSIFSDEMQSREEVLLISLIRFYKKEPKYLNMISDVSRQKTSISLREMDYTVTNYSYNNKVKYTLGSGEEFNMYIDYKNQLRGFSKRCLDPFRRRQRIFLDYETLTPIFLNDTEVNTYEQREDGLVTTIGQLNFFKWALNNDVIKYCFENKEAIDKEMELADNKKKEKNKSANKVSKIKNENENEIKVIIQFS